MPNDHVTLTVPEIRRLAEQVSRLSERVILLHGTAQQAKICVGIQALQKAACVSPGTYVLRMLSHRQTDSVIRHGDDSEVRDLVSRLRKKRSLSVGKSEFVLDTARSRTKKKDLAGAVIYCAESFGRYADQIQELNESTTGKIIFATWTDNADMSWLEPYSPKCIVVHTHRSDYHARMLGLAHHMSKHDYENGALRPSSWNVETNAPPKPQSPAERIPAKLAIQDPYVHIDPGFINFRLCASTFRTRNVLRLIDDRSSRPNPLACVVHHHRLVEFALEFCRANDIGTLAEALANPSPGTLISSVETVRGSKKVYHDSRVRFLLKLPYNSSRRVFLEFGTSHFVSDTGKAEAGMTSRIALVGKISRVNDREVTIYPIIMGHPTLEHKRNNALSVDLAWEGPDWYWTPAELIDEFSRARKAPLPAPGEWQPVMRKLPEKNVKASLCNLLNETPSSDWGGEQNDLFSAGIHLGGQRMTAAFVLKGPAGGRKFKRMTPAMLGKNADQIYRLSQSPAHILIVQHCHDIDEAVRATLAAFAQNLGRPRRYCLIDGRETYRILKAHGEI